MTTQQTVEQDSSTLFADYARLELELDIAVDLQLKIKQASIWTYNAWTITDAFLERDESKELIDRLERQSTDADVIKADVDAMVKNLRDRKRKMTKKLKWKVYSPEVKAEQSKAVEIANDQVEAIADKLLAEKEVANKPQLAIVKSESVSKSKKTKK
ncbi:MAG: hypothetical protein ACR2HG_03435 [Pyrinomonadaceae bacterium]